MEKFSTIANHTVILLSNSWLQLWSVIFSELWLSILNSPTLCDPGSNTIDLCDIGNAYMSRLVTMPMPDKSFHCYGSPLPTSTWDIISLNFISILQHSRGLDKHLMKLISFLTWPIHFLSCLYLDSWLFVQQFLLKQSLLTHLCRCPKLKTYF